MLTVEDILGARPSLRDRAVEAHKIAKEVEAARRLDEEQDIILQSCEFLRKELQCTEAEIEDVEFFPSAYTPDGEQRQVDFKVDGVRFRGTLVNKQVASIAQDGGTTRENIYERVLRLQVTRTGNAFVEVKSLADVGKAIQQ